jgi:hypothetical protein
MAPALRMTRSIKEKLPIFWGGGISLYNAYGLVNIFFFLFKPLFRGWKRPDSNIKVLL